MARPERASDSANQAYAQISFEDLFIRTKDARLERFTPNDVQADYLDDVCPRWKDGVYQIEALRETILKFRQPGFSTVIGALIFVNTYNRPNIRSLVLAQDLEATKILFEMHRRFYDHLPPEGKRPLREDSRTGLHFRDIDSRIYVGTAGRYSIGRGATINYLHMSERAKWKLSESALRELDAGLKEAVPLGGCIWKETTANGLNPFYYEYQADKGGETPYRASFFGWNRHREYALPVGSHFARTPEEEELAQTHGLTDGQLQWRRVKRSDLKELFPQEYPLDDVECFIRSTDDAYFITAYLVERAKALSAPIRVIHRSDGIHGELRIYQEPVRFEQIRCRCGETFRPRRRHPGTGEFICPECGREHDSLARYVIGADVAMGLTKGASRDYSTFDVFRRDTWEQVASYHAQVTPDLFGRDLGMVGRYFNDARILVERTSHAFATLQLLQEGDAVEEIEPYPNLAYDMHRGSRPGGEPVVDRQAGWLPTAANKTYALDQLGASINDAARVESLSAASDSAGRVSQPRRPQGESALPTPARLARTGVESRVQSEGIGGPVLVLNDARGVAELIDFAHLPGGGSGAKGSGHDDHVTSISLAHILLMEGEQHWNEPMEPNRPVVLYGG